MCEVMSSSGVVVGVCGTWCAAWDGFFVPCPLFFAAYKWCGAVEEPRCVSFAGPEGHAVNRCNGRLGAIWCNTIKLGQVVIITVCFTMYYLVINQLLHYALSCWAPVC